MSGTQQIDAEIARLEALATARQAARDADLSKHVSLMDFGLQGRLQGELAGFRDKIAELHEQRHAIMLDPAKEAPAPTAPARSKAKKMSVADRKTLDEFRQREAAVLARFGVSAEAGQKAITLAEHLTSMADMADVIRSLSERLAAVESADQYRGTFQRAVSYRKGMQVTFNGALWVAIDDAPRGVVPGMSSVWQLASKGGKPVKAGKAAT